MTGEALYIIGTLFQKFLQGVATSACLGTASCREGSGMTLCSFIASIKLPQGPSIKV